ncbi:MAG: bifunctional hydroxymethylpyrimidine kinase/phosphomethylpyrimidine kinase [Wenzhouxiangellaceae bacterium]
MIGPGPRAWHAALTIAGSDSSGGAGIQADLKTFAAFDVFGASAITALTAQNTVAVTHSEAASGVMVSAQIKACLDDLPIAAIKTGMLANREIVQAVASALTDRNLPLIVDPVMIATSGARLLDDDAVAAVINQLLPLATLVTPNLPEAVALAGADLPTAQLGEKLLRSGAAAVLIKGGHGSDKIGQDWLISANRTRVFEWTRLDGQYHGTGCALAAAITALLARGESLDDAVEQAGAWLHEQLQGALKPRRGPLRMLPFRPPTACG